MANSNEETGGNDDWNLKKSICYVFSDVFSRSPNQDFVQNVLTKLKKSSVIDGDDVEAKIASFLLESNQAVSKKGFFRSNQTHTYL